MKKSWIILVGLFTLLIMISLISGVRVNEVMAKTPLAIYGDSGCEWIELYSSSSKNLTNWIVNTPGHNLTLNIFINDFLIITGNKTCFKNNWEEVSEDKIIEWSAISLNDVGDDVSIFDNSSQLKNSITYESAIEDKSWQYCPGNWVERNPTPGLSNNCTTEQSDNGNTEDEEEAPIYLEIDWSDEDIINGQEFEIEVKAFNLKDELYDLKVWIEFKGNDTVISDRYDAEGEEWKSGRYYIEDLFEGPGNETEDIKLRIREDYKDFYGRAKIFFKIENEEENDRYIDILEREEEEDDEEVPKVLEPIQTAPITGSVIKLGTSEVSTETEDIKTKDNIVYESKTELIKKYSIYVFALLCVGICILLGFKRLN